MTEPATQRPSGAGPFLLGLGALLLLAAALGIFVVPAADCPRCTTWNFFGSFEHWDVHELDKPCRVCKGKRKAPLFRKWTYRQ